ncbi:MAG: thioether cross-link-forming SCIFF peptide maturase [Lachnospiraceae bacterium]|nr:thioether cross-link-forming SCIFF peptide maturase [Lachnospiraceae bacterium]
MIHQYKNNGYNIVLDVNSGAIHVVDDISYDMIAEMNAQVEAKEQDIIARAQEAAKKASLVEGGVAASEEAVKATLEYLDDDAIMAVAKKNLAEGKYADDADCATATDAEIAEALGEIKELIKDQTLFTVDIYENRIVDYKNRNTVVKALCLHIAHDCNLACKYCFAEEGEYHGRRALMDYETGKQALDFLIANSGSRKNLEVDFFGGEPLLNFEVVKKLVAYGREQEKLHDKHFRFTLTTNGVLLNDEVKEFANKECDNVVLSIDGRKEIHDMMRPFRKGAGSYDIIVPKFQDLAESRNQERYYVRGTFTHFNLDFSKDVLHLADLGFKQISVEPVVAQETDEYALREEDLPILFEEYDKLAAEMVKREKEGNAFNFFHFMIDLEGGPCVYKRLSGCGSGTEYLAVTPWGDLYPCHQFVGNEKFLMGNVWDGVKNTELRDEFKGCNVYAKEKCRKCFARFYCSGGCAANSYNFHGHINDAYDLGCELQKKRIECAIMIKAAEAEM